MRISIIKAEVEGAECEDKWIKLSIKANEKVLKKKA